MRMQFWLRILAAVLILVPALSGTAHAQTIRWKMMSLWGAGSLPQKINEEFAARVKQLSGGRLLIDALPKAGRSRTGGQIPDAELDIGLPPRAVSGLGEILHQLH